KKQRDRPALQRRLAGIRYLVEVGIEPGCAGQSSGAGSGNSSDNDRSAGASGFCWGVPRYQTSVCESGAGGNCRSNLRTEPQVDRLPGLQRTIGCGVVCCYYRPGYSHTGRCAVHGRRWVHERETAYTRTAEIVSDYDRRGLKVRRVVRGVGHVYQVVKLPSRQRSAATDHADLLGNFQSWDDYCDDLSEVRSFEAEKRVTLWWNATVAKIDDPTVRVKYRVVNSSGSIAVRVRCDCAIGVRPKRAKSPSRKATSSIVLETENRDRCATELQSGDGFTGVVHDTNHVVVKAVIVRGGRVGESCCDRPVSVERDQNGTALVSASILIREIGGTHTPPLAGIAAGDNGARLRLGKCRVGSHHQNDDGERKQNSLLGKSHAEGKSEAQLVEQPCDPAVACTHMNCATRNHLLPHSTRQFISGPRPVPQGGLNSGGPAVVGLVAR